MKTINRNSDIMRYLRLFLIALPVWTLLPACSQDKFQESADGYQYRYVRQNQGEKPQDGAYLQFNLRYSDERDSVLYDTGKSPDPVVIPFNSQQWAQGGPFYKALLTMTEGDSMIIRIPTKTLFEESFQSRVPSDLDSGGQITMYVGLARMMMESEFMEMIEAREGAQLDADIAVIEEYLTAAGITAQSTESGLRYVITSEGTGPKPAAGATVKVHYTGSLLDGTVFDSSVERGEPIAFPLGMGQVIPGWDEGIALLSKGTKATLYIPSSLAYGSRGAGGVIPPNSVLKFDVELVDFE